MKKSACIALVLLAGCGGGVDPAATKVEIEALVKKYHEAFDMADVKTVLDLLDPAISISRPTEGFVRGKDTCGSELEKAMNRLKEQNKIGKRSTLFGSIHVEVEGNTAIATYLAFIREDKDQSNAIFTRVFRRTDKDPKWRILSEHYSFESQQK